MIYLHYPFSVPPLHAEVDMLTGLHFDFTKKVIVY